MDELTEMRQQLAAMKESLDRTQLANRALLRKVMKNKASFPNGVVWAEIIALPFVVLIILANCSFYHSTPWVAWVFLIMAAVDIAFDIKNVRIAPRDINELPMLVLRQKLLRQKYRRRIQTVIGLALCLIWTVWAFAEWFKPFDYIEAIKSGDPWVWFVIVLLAVLMIFATMFALWLLRKIDRTADSILAELPEEEDVEQ